MLASVMQMQLLPAVLALAAFLVAILLTLYIVRMLFGRRIRVPSARKGPKRLDIVDAFDLDRERQLVIVRRDNVEHLLLIGGPSDILIEAGFARSAAAAQPEARAEGREPRLSAQTATPGWPSPPEGEEEAAEAPLAARDAGPPRIPAPPAAAPREAQSALSAEALRRRFSESPRPAPRPPEPPRAPPAPGVTRPQAPQPGRMGPPPSRGPEPQQWEGGAAAPAGPGPRPDAPASPARPTPPGLTPRPAGPPRPIAPSLAPRPPRPAPPPPAAPPPAENPPQESHSGRPPRESLESLESLEAEMARLLGRPEGQ